MKALWNQFAYAPIWYTKTRSWLPCEKCVVVVFSSQEDALLLCRHTFPAAQLRNTFVFSGLAKSRKVIAHKKNNTFTPNLIGLCEHTCDYLIVVCMWRWGGFLSTNSSSLENKEVEIHGKLWWRDMRGPQNVSFRTSSQIWKARDKKQILQRKN